jgi:signal transduction histidine kinase
MVLLAPQPVFHDLTQVFSALRLAVRSAVAGSNMQTILWLGEHLDSWVVQVVTRYDALRARQSRKRWQDMVQRLARLNTLSYCVAELTTSLDLASAFTATVELARLLAEADLCTLYQREGDVLRLRAFAGIRPPTADVIPITLPQLLEQTIVDRNHTDVPLEVVQQNLGVPEARAIHCLPLQINDVITGKLTFVFFTEKTFTIQELRLQEIFAGHAAQAIYNAQLYERLSVLTAANERRQIACEMHDTLLQTLISLNINLRVMHNHAQQGRWDQVLPLIDSVRDLGKLAVQEGRDTLNDLRGCDDNVRDRDLIDALQPEIAAFADRSGLQPQFIFRDDVYVPANVSHHLCRLIGEALTNVHRHARANSVQIIIVPSEDQLLIRVCDDGVGFHLARVDQQNSFGLMGMQERARLIDAQIAIETAPAQGTTVTISCPLRLDNGSK